jgi:serine/threonine-protein kinase
MSNEELMRAALAEMGQLLDKPRAERAAVLNSLAHSKPDLHALVMDLLAYETSVNRGFMETGDGSNGNAILKEDSRLGPYRIIRLLGEGGMGEVWLASRDDGLYEGLVAIKTLHPYFAGGALRARFLREAKVLGRLAHSNIARLLDAGIQDGVVYLVLEYVVGQPIDAACDERKFGVRERLGIFLRLCDAVGHAHSSLVVHRDIKPGNVLLTEDGVPKLLDFGIANFYEAEAGGKASDLTRLTGRIFTPEYAAPEQVLGQEITTAADVYSLGVLLHVLLTGRLPYADSGRGQLEHAVLHQEPQRMAQALESAEQDVVARNRSVSAANLRRELGGDLENIVQKALKKRPEERYLTAAAFAEDIRRYLQGEPIFARADSAWYRLKKFSQRNRLAVGSTIAVVVALGIGLAVSLWQLQVARAERQRAEESKEFIASIFRSADPYYTGKESMTAIELLTLARQRIDRELASQPENAVELLTLVGESQTNLHQRDEARATLTKAIEMAERMQPRDDILLAAARAQLAVVASDRGEWPEVRTLVAQALPDLRKHQPRTSRELNSALLALGFAESDERNHEAAIALGEEAVAVAIVAFGEAHSETISSRSHLAFFLQAAKKLEESRALCEQVLRDSRALASNGEHVALLIQAEGRYGTVLTFMGDPKAAIPHFKAAIELAERLYEPRNSWRSTWIGELARAQARAGDFKGVLATRLLEYEATEPGLLRSRALTNFSRSAIEAAKVPEALDLSRRAIELEKQYDTGKGTWLLIAQSSYGYALALSGRFAEADRVLQAGLPLIREGNNNDRSLVWNPVGLNRQLQSQWGESEQAFRIALGDDEASRPINMMRAEALLGIGIARLEMSQAVEAENLLRQADEWAGKHFIAMVPLRANISMNLGRTLLAQGKIAAANEAFAVANTYWLDYDAENRCAGEAAYWLGQGHLAAGTKPEARAALTRAIDILKSSPLPGHARLVKDARQAVARL